ncbi:MAG: type II secretion system protein GspF, partial [Moraxellaceae bacterium]
KALDEAGKTVKGILEGDSERHVRTQLRAKRLKPLEVEGASSQPDKSGADDSAGLSLGAFRKRMGGKLSSRDLSIVTRQLASLVRSGLPLDEALHATAKQAHKPHIKRILLGVRTKVLEGFSLAQALGENPAAFDEMYRALVRAGESSGYLGPVLERLADYTQNSQIVQQRIKMAMIYPIVLLVISLGVIVLLMAMVVPKLIGVFAHSHRELPVLTRVLITSSDFIVNYGVFVFIGIVAIIVSIRNLLKKEYYKRKWHAAQLKLPVIGELVRQIDASRFAATLSLLTASGVPLLQALTIAGQVMTNRLLQESCEQVVNAVREGTGLARAMENAGTFPPLLVQLVSSGEANGTLAQQLDNAAKDQERELEMVLGMAMGLLEPFTIVFMGFSVCMIVLAILQPIFQMNSLV